jgi:hypothetical protein
VGDLLADRRRAVVLWVGDRERAGADFVLKDIYAELVEEGGLFKDELVLLDVIRDLDESGYLRQVAGVAQGTVHPIVLTERGGELYARLRASRVRRLSGWFGEGALRFLAMGVAAIIGAAATLLVQRMFPGQ